MSDYFARGVPAVRRDEWEEEYSPQHPLFVLAKELETRMVPASVDVSISVVDAYQPPEAVEDTAWLRTSGKVTQRAILRADPVTGHPWWWLLWPGERFKAEVAEPEIERLLPVERVEEAARRIQNILVLIKPC